MADYKTLIKQIESISQDVEYDITILSNVSALIYETLDNLNWCGFYILRNNRLELGPFQGKVACTKIEIGKGVCGTSVLKDETILVKDVHEFPGHIACDSASNSEIVIPIHINGSIYGVLDIDSPMINRFSDDDKKNLEEIVMLIENYLK